MSSGIEFEEDRVSMGYPQYNAEKTSVSYKNPYAQNNNQEKGMAGWLIRHGWAKNSGQAQIYLLTLVFINVVITIIAITYLI